MNTTTHIKTETQQASPEQGRRVPALRFKEFEGQFQLKEFDEITDITRLAGYEYSKYWQEDEEQEIIALRGYNIGKGELVLRDLGYISNALSMQLIRSRLSIGDIVYPCVGSIGNAVVIEENDKFHIQQNIAKITCNEFASPYYVVQFLTSDYGMREVYRFNASGAQPNVLVGSLRKYRINIPTLPEQQKIASFLSAVDEKIQQLSKKKEFLEDYKKGVMQQLFSQKLRFKQSNGAAYPDWEEKKLEQIADIKRGAGSQYITYVNNPEDGIRLVRITDFLGGESVYVKETNDIKRFTLDKDDILIAGTGATAGITFKIPDSLIGLAFSYNAPRIRMTNGNAEFTIQYLKSPIILRQQNALFTGNAQPFLDTKAIKNFKMHVPSSKEEQQKIASYLSSIDTKIVSLNNQITQTQEFKKGLLQQMFVAA